MGRDVRIAIIGDASSFSRAAKTADDAASRIGGAARRLSGIAKVGFGAAAIGAVGFGKSSVEAFVEAEKSQTALADAFSRFPNLAGTSVGALQKINDELMRKTRFDDDALASGQAIIAQFGLTGKEVESITPLLADYAAKTGRELPDAATTMGKAFLGNTRALKELGIDYKMTGDKAKDMAAIQQLLTDKVGGFAEKEGKTAAGQAEILRNQFGELQEKVGGALLPVLSKVAGWLIKNLPGAVNRAQAAFEAFKPKIQAVVEFVRAHWPKVQKVIQQVMDAVKDVISGVVEVVTTLWRNFGDNILDFVRRTWPNIQQVISGAMEFIRGVIKTVTALIKGDWSAVWDGIKSIVSGVWTAIQGIVKHAIEVVRLAVGAGLEVLKSIWRSTWEGIKDFVGGVWEGIRSKVQSGIDTVKGVIQSAVDGIKGIWSGAWDSLVGGVRDLKGRVNAVASGLFDGIKNAFRSAINGLISIWNNFRIHYGGFDIPGPGPNIPSFTIDTPNIPYLASGGIVSRPTLAMIGEKGPEAVVPLSRGGGFMGGPQTIIVQLGEVEVARVVANAAASGARRGIG